MADQYDYDQPMPGEHDFTPSWYCGCTDPERVSRAIQAVLTSGLYIKQLRILPMRMVVVMAKGYENEAWRMDEIAERVPDRGAMLRSKISEREKSQQVSVGCQPDYPEENEGVYV